MGKANAVALIVAGLTISASVYLLPPGTPDKRERTPMQVDFANTASAPIASGAWRQIGVAPEEAEAAPKPTVVVTLPNDARPTTVPQTATSVPRDRASLARELQGELKRVGCYGAEINGVWTTSTRQAMKAFADRVNATLPVDEPDIILLTLVRAYQDKVCGKPCPSGQSLVDEDRCVPNALMAQPTKGAPQSAPGRITGWSASTTVAPVPPTPQEDRMALAGPTSEAPAALAPGAGPPPASVARKPIPSPKRFGAEVFRKLDKQGSY